MLTFLLKSVVAPYFDRYIVEIYAACECTTGPAPCINFRRPGMRLKNLQIDPSMAWYMLQVAASSHQRNLTCVLEAMSLSAPRRPDSGPVARGLGPP